MSENSVGIVIGGLVVGTVILFVGLFMTNIVATIQSPSYYYDYGYTTAANTSTQTLNSAANATHYLTMGTIASISGETTVSELSTNVTNVHAATDFTVNVYLNDALLGVITAPHDATTQTVFTSVPWVASSANKLVYQTTAGAANLTTLKSYGTYPSSQIANSFGTMYDNLVNTTATIFSVMGLIIIVAALGVAIKSLQSSV